MPNLAALRQLEPVDTLSAKPSRPTHWSSTRGTLFVVGILMTLAGLVCGGFGAYLIRNVDLDQVDKYYNDIEQGQLEEIDQMTPIQAYEVWERIRVMGPGVADSAPQAQVRAFYEFWLRVCWIGFGGAAIGILMAAGSLVQPSGKS